MAKANYVSKEATRQIWLSFAARYALGMLAEIVLAHADSFIADVLGFILDCWIWQWAVRESFRDKYENFTFTAENKKTGLSVFNAQGRLTLWAALRVWWALGWRLSLVPIAIGTGLLFVCIITGRGIFEAMADYDASSTQYFTDIVMLAVSYWAMHESLADRYWGFRFVEKPKRPSAGT